MSSLDELKLYAAAALNLERRKLDSRLLFYTPCCRAHSEWDVETKSPVIRCPVLPCPDSKHWKFHMSDARIRVIFGANRSSKTITSLIDFLMMACFKTHPLRKTRNPEKFKGRIYGSDFGVVEKLFIPLIKEWIPIDSLARDGPTKEEAFENSYDVKYHLLHLRRGGLIDFMSYDQATSKSASVELDAVLADEEMPEDVYGETMARLVSRNGKFMMAVTPLYNMSWGMRLLESEDRQIETFRFEIWDNPYLPPDVVRDYEKTVLEHEREARLYGRFLEFQGLVYPEIRPEIHYIQPDIRPRAYPVIFCLDPHPRKPCVMTWAYITPKSDAVFFDELELGGTARDIVHAIRSKEKAHSGRTMLRLIDPAAKAQGSNLSYEIDTLMEFEREGMGFTLADSSDAGYNVVHEYLTYNPAFPLSAMNRPRCFFTRDVPKTWHSMTHLMWGDWLVNRTMRDKKERIRDFQKDFADCVRYTLAVRPAQRTFSDARPVPIGGYPGANIEQNKVRQFLNI